jgi:Rad3-related DNA helicase
MKEAAHHHHAMQDELSEDMVKNIFDFKMYEAPTGFGKTHVLLKTAAKLLKKYGKKVIISTVNNKLVRDMYETSQSHDFGMGADAFSIIIGKSNYIDTNKLNRLVETGEIFDFITQESYQDWLNTIQKDEALFFDALDEKAIYLDQARAKEFQSLVVFENKPVEASDFATSIVSITNHFYLLYRAAIVKNIDLSEYFILLDEVHEISNVAENVFEASFSPFNLKNLSSRLLKEIDKSDVSWKGKKTFESSLSNVIRKMDNIVQSGIMHANDNIGDYIISGKVFETLSKTVSDYYQSDAFIEFNATTNKALQIFDRDKNRFTAERGLIFAIKKELSELSSVARSKKSNANGIYLSPTKGYPTYKTLTDNPLAVLHFEFWEKLHGFAGLSATLLVDTKNNEKGHTYAYRRLGINHKKASPIKQYNRVFPKENVTVYMPDESFIDPISIDGDAELRTEWILFVVEYIKNHYEGKNTLVMSGGYSEAKLLAEALAIALPNENIIYTSPQIQTSQTIRQFEREGGILVGIRNYGTGISLVGEKLQKLFLLRLPYPIFTSKKWLDLKQRQPEYYWGKFINEMLIAFRQTLGRLQRTPTDSGDIYILDSRIFSRGKKGKGKYSNPEIKRRVWYFAGQYGKIKNEKPSEFHPIESTETTLLTLGQKVEPKKEADSLDWLV